MAPRDDNMNCEIEEWIKRVVVFDHDSFVMPMSEFNVQHVNIQSGLQARSVMNPKLEGSYRGRKLKRIPDQVAKDRLFLRTQQVYFYGRYLHQNFHLRRSKRLSVCPDWFSCHDLVLSLPGDLHYLATRCTKLRSLAADYVFCYPSLLRDPKSKN